jgi:hypothetical protein
MAEFIEDVRSHREPAPGLRDAQAALEIVSRVYTESARDHRA